jgi:hypothetical protein
MVLGNFQLANEENVPFDLFQKISDQVHQNKFDE